MSADDPMTREQFDAIRERVDATTEGPWTRWAGLDDRDNSVASDGREDAPTVADVIPEKDDAVFIAHAREDVPALLAEVERLRALTTVDKDMVERGSRTFYEYPTPGLDASLRTDWDRLTKASPDVAVNYRAHVRAVLEAALGTGENV